MIRQGGDGKRGFGSGKEETSRYIAVGPRDPVNFRGCVRFQFTTTDEGGCASVETRERNSTKGPKKSCSLTPSVDSSTISFRAPLLRFGGACLAFSVIWASIFGGKSSIAFAGSHFRQLLKCRRKIQISSLTSVAGTCGRGGRIVNPATGMVALASTWIDNPSRHRDRLRLAMARWA